MKILKLKVIYQNDDFLKQKLANNNNKYIELTLNNTNFEVDCTDIYTNDYISNIINNSKPLIIPSNKIIFNVTDNKLIYNCLKYEYLLTENNNISIDEEQTNLKSIYLISIILKLELLIKYIINNYLYKLSNSFIIFYFFIISLYYNNIEVSLDIYYILCYFISNKNKYYKMHNNCDYYIDINLITEEIYLNNKNIQNIIVFKYSNFKNIFKNNYIKYIENKYCYYSNNYEIKYIQYNKSKTEFFLKNYNNEIEFYCIKQNNKYKIFDNITTNELSPNYYGYISYSISGLKYYFYNKFNDIDCLTLINDTSKNRYRILKVDQNLTAINADPKEFKLFIYNIKDNNLCFVLNTKKPIYNNEKNVYELDLFQQSSIASTKNYQLIEFKNNKNISKDNSDIYYLHCKQKPGNIIIHYMKPINSLTGFITSIISIIKKKLE